MPRNATSERHTIMTVVGVTTLSTVAMITYPLIVRLRGLDDAEAGIFLGGTIHDVTDRLHPTLRKAAIDAARAIDIPVTGLDMIVPDPKRPDYVMEVTKPPVDEKTDDGETEYDEKYDEALALVRAGVLSATSVSFLPIRGRPRENGAGVAS